MNVLSLFTGAGGLDIAACSTGYVKKIVSTDSNETFLATTSINLPMHFPGVEHVAFPADVRNLTGAQLVDKLGCQPDILMGGPPCDDYTHFGRRMGLEGDKGPLIFEFLRLVKETRPSCFVFENVPNLAQQFKPVFEEFLEGVKRLGYNVTWELLMACDYGAPTMRKRVFAVGWRGDLQVGPFEFPLPSHEDIGPEIGGTVQNSKKPYVFVADVLKDLPDVTSANAHSFHNHTGRTHRPATIEHLKTVPQGVHIKKSYRYRAPWLGLCRSLTAGVDHSTKSYIHPVFHREMSVREYARIHGFPDSWVFNGTHHNGIKQVANAVPVPLGSAILGQVAKTYSNLDQEGGND